MKKSIAMFIISAVITSWVGISLPGNIVFAVQEEILENSGHDPADIPEDNERLDKVAEDEKGNSVKESEKYEEPILQGKEIEKNNRSLSVDKFDRNDEQIFENDTQDVKKAFIYNEQSDFVEREEKNDSEKEAMASLQIPEKLDITIDPFEINGKGQIYSKEYCIKNSGERAGVLKISNFMCTPGTNSGVIIKNDSNGIHDSNEKFVYIEILFGNGHRIAFPSEEAEYEVRLEPGEKLRFFYKGEVNENAPQGWKAHDLMVGMTYFWNIEKEVLKNEIDVKREEIPVLDSENEENTLTEDELRMIWGDEGIPKTAKSENSQDMEMPEGLFSEEMVNEENVEEEVIFGDKDFQKLKSDLTDRNKN